MYTWGYIKDVTLAKLDLTEQEAVTQNLLGRFVYYANEAMTQICSSVKPKQAFFELDIDEHNISDTITMPEDFISFGDELNSVMWIDSWGNTYFEEAHDDFIEFVGYNKLRFKHVGKYSISYNARWIMFTKNMDNYEVLDAPVDVLECLPSYIAYQCFKIDDEYKSAVFRNEYETFLARIDTADIHVSHNISIRGDW